MTLPSKRTKSAPARRGVKKASDKATRPPKRRAVIPKRRLIILGAGFSRPAGLPLATELWSEIRMTAARFPASQRAHKFNDDLEDYIAFRKEADDCDLTTKSVDFEDFMRFLDIEHYLGLRGGDTWSEEGNEGTVVTKHLIGKILARHVSALKDVPALYIEFAKRLQPNDIVITFNYDTLLERALDAIGKNYRLFSTRYKTVFESGGTVDSDDDEVVVLKVHGSLDWFDRTGFERRLATHKELGAPAPQDVIFSNVTALRLERLVDGPRPDNDPLKSIYRAKDLRALHARDLLFLATPRILPPSAAKLLYSNRLSDFWEGMGFAGSYNFGMAIVGFSLPLQDEYARQIIYGLVTRYQRFRRAETDFGMKKSPLAIVDFFRDAASEARYRERYRFVDWSRANLIGTGFDLASLDKIFA